MHRSEDDLTHKLSDIVKANMKLARFEAQGSPEHILKEFAALLQFHITTYIDNTVPGQPVATQRGGRPIKSVSQRLKVKTPLQLHWGCLCTVQKFSFLNCCLALSPSSWLLIRATYICVHFCTLLDDLLPSSL